ncbi:MAG TPA: aminodeoxychorismate synthase component I [Gammaproteobacteria bacterium]|nr:aminodeoxychorismate synthase component I [Gammaproteobacteria bacterium]
MHLIALLRYMSTSQIIPLPYPSNSLDWFGKLQSFSYPVLLDSGSRESGLGRYDILCADPYQLLFENEGHYFKKVIHQNVAQVTNPLETLRTSISHQDSNQQWPFTGGAIGYFSYDFGAQLQGISLKSTASYLPPHLNFAFYAWAIVIDHLEKRAALIIQPEFIEKNFDSRALIKHLIDSNTYQTQQVELGAVSTNTSHDTYLRAVDKILQYIQAGDCYQVNLSQQFQKPATGDPWDLYLQLRRHTPEPYSAFLRFANYAVMSFSPERFLRVEQDQVLSEPIKGTRPRGLTNSADRELQIELSTSPKDRAENIMIVDLLRNDLGRVCETGSIKVEHLCELKSFSKVHHLISEISGRLKPSQDSVHLLSACLPGGSITGAPKIRVMEIIDELEPHRRGIYCGTICYFSFNGRMDSNIAIRTALHYHNQLYYCSGGGIVADSNAENEYQESLDKAAVLF